MVVLYRKVFKCEFMVFVMLVEIVRADLSDSK